MAITRLEALKLAGTAAAAAILAAPRAAPSPLSDRDIVNVRDFGATGDNSTDDTDAIQAALDHCFGSPSSPHGTSETARNKALFFPPGVFKITSTLRLAKVQGARIIGSGRFATTVTNVTSGASVFSTNGCGYCHFEGMQLVADASNGTIFDLNWDGSPGGPALQSNTFADLYFSGGAVGVDIGAGGFMGSENLFINCFWSHQTRAGLKTSNFNALQNTVVGGNFQDCGIGVWVHAGSVCLIASTGFQLSKVCDIRVSNSANDTIQVAACRTESPNFVHLDNGVHALIQACSHLCDGVSGFFLSPNACPTTVERCVSTNGNIILGPTTRLVVRGSSFARADWLSGAEAIDSDSYIEIEDVQYGGTPNTPGRARPVRICKQRMVNGGALDYGTTFRVTAGLGPMTLLAGGAHTVTVAVPGAALGDIALASSSNGLRGVRLQAWVSARDSVSVSLENATADKVSLPKGSISVQVNK